MSGHSPLPWRIRHGRFIENDEYRLASLAIVPVNATDQDSIDQGLADAAFIVKAVNNHDQLLGALKRIESGMSSHAIELDKFGVIAAIKQAEKP